MPTNKPVLIILSITSAFLFALVLVLFLVLGSGLIASGSGDTFAERERAGLDTLRDVTDGFDNLTDSDLTEMAEATCTAMDDGVIADDVREITYEVWGAEGGAFLAFTTDVYCPEHENMLDPSL